MTLEELAPFLIDNWDTEGAKPISLALYHSAEIFIKLHSTIEPECNPCCDGSLDYVWRSDKARLLINIRNKNGIYEASFYGDYYDNSNQIKETIPLGLFYKPLYEWLKIFLSLLIY